jgi:hypothetical protein
MFCTEVAEKNETDFVCCYPLILAPACRDKYREASSGGSTVVLPSEEMRLAHRKPTDTDVEKSAS